MSLIFITESFFVAGLVALISVVAIATSQRGPIQANTPIPTGDLAVAALIFLITLIGSWVLYFLPTMVAIRRRNLDSQQVVWVNILAGWSVIGWIIALIMALGGRAELRPAHFGRNAQLSPDGLSWWDGRQWNPMPAGTRPFRG